MIALNSCVILIPLYKSFSMLSEGEKLSIRRTITIFSGYDIIFIAPESIKTESKLSKNKTKELTLGWIKELISYFNKVDKIAENIEVKKIHNELFLIRKE